jgi:hypothetical protein
VINRSNQRSYSITSSARASSVGGTSKWIRGTKHDGRFAGIAGINPL